MKIVAHYKRHLIFMRLARFLIGPFIKVVFGFKYDREKMPETPTIIISNHNSNLDPALVMIALHTHSYFVASEHVLRKGLESKLLKFFFDPIPINKTQPGTYTLREVFRRLKAGFNICVFAEGNRSYNGLTGPIPLSTAKMVKMSGAELLTYRLEGGYFTTPRWAKRKRRGKINGKVIGRYSAGELKPMSKEQVLAMIERDIYEDAYERQREHPIRFRRRGLAEYIEIALYLCPLCKRTGTIHSKGNTFSCDCGLKARYTDTGFLEGENLPFSTITEWDRWQTEYMQVIVKNAGDGPICTNVNQKLFKVNAATDAVCIGKGPMSINRAEFSCAGHVFPLQEIKQFAIVDIMTLQFALKDGTQYEVKSSYPRSALGYYEVFRILRGDNGFFFG